MDERLSLEDKRFLLKLAREAITRAVYNQPSPPVDLDQLSEPLREEGASFVTLTIQGQLRGCIGTVEAYLPLAVDVAENAVRAAFHDPRFYPLTPEELDQVEIEISVLTPPQPLEFSSPEELVRKLRPGVDGVILQKGFTRATFLPQVWEKLPDPPTFLAHLCTKAGLPPDAWQKPGIQVYTYRVEEFSEKEIAVAQA